MTKYHLHALADAVSAEDIATVHHRIFHHLKKHSPFCAEGMVPAVPRITGSAWRGCAELDGFLPAGMTGSIEYIFRRDPAVYVLSGQDSLVIDFVPDACLYRNVIDGLIPHLVQAMRPTALEMGDEQFDELLWIDGKARLGGPKACGCKLKPVFFLTYDWFGETYRITPDEARKVLEPVADRVTPMADGLYVVAARELVSFEEARERVLRMEESLRLAKPGLRKFFRSVLRRGRQ